MEAENSGRILEFYCCFYITRLPIIIISRENGFYTNIEIYFNFEIETFFLSTHMIWVRGEVLKKKRCDAVLKVGSTCGIGLVGAVYQMERNGYTFENVAGSSAGAIIASLSGRIYR